MHVNIRFTDRFDGDLCVELSAGELAARRGAIAPLPWTWLHQVHGARVVVAESAGDQAGQAADAVVTAAAGVTLAVHTADCAGVLLWGDGPRGPVIGAAHAGWRGVEAGVLQATVATMRGMGTGPVTWQLGPCISPAHYEFSPADLERLAARLGDGVRGVTDDGRPAFDLRAAVAAALGECGPDVQRASAGVPDPVCTAADERYYSWRERHDSGRQAAVIWIGSSPDDPGTGASARGSRPTIR